MNKTLDWNQIRKSAEQQKKIQSHQTSNSVKVDQMIWKSMKVIFNGHTM